MLVSNSLKGENVNVKRNKESYTSTNENEMNKRKNASERERLSNFRHIENRRSISDLSAAIVRDDTDSRNVLTALVPSVNEQLIELTLQAFGGDPLLAWKKLFTDASRYLQCSLLRPLLNSQNSAHSLPPAHSDSVPVTFCSTGELANEEATKQMPLHSSSICLQQNNCCETNHEQQNQTHIYNSQNLCFPQENADKFSPEKTRKSFYVRDILDLESQLN